MEHMGYDKIQKGQVKKSTLSWLLEEIRGKRWIVVLLTVLQIMHNTLSVSYALIFRDLIDRAVGQQLPGFYSAMIQLVIVVAFQIGIRGIIRYLEEYTRSGMENILKRRFLNVLLRKPYIDVVDVHSGEWMSRMTSDAAVVADGVTQIVPNLGGLAMRLLGALCLIVMLEPKVGLLVMPAGLAFAVVIRLLRLVMKRLHRQVQEADAQVRMLLQERLDSQLILRAYDQQERTGELASEKMLQHHRARLRRTAMSNLNTIGFGVIMQGMYLAGAFVSCLGIIQGTVSFGTMTALLQLIGLLQTPLSEFGRYFNQWFAMLASADRLKEVGQLPEDSDVKKPSVEQAEDFYRREFTGIEVDNVSFSYLERGTDADRTRVTIRNVSLQIHKGEFVALVGSSGSGKSTLLKLLMGLFTPDSGQIRFLREAPLEPRVPEQGDSALFAYVPQGNQLMSGTVREVLCWSDPQIMAQDSRLWRALEVACAREFVEQMPGGLDARLGEHGSGLSEGQIQRLALARALVSGRPILLLDEATSSLDELTERRVLDNLRTMTGHTLVLVTHRPRACEICDRIVQLKPGAGE